MTDTAADITQKKEEVKDAFGIEEFLKETQLPADKKDDASASAIPASASEKKEPEGNGQAKSTEKKEDSSDSFDMEWNRIMDTDGDAAKNGNGNEDKTGKEQKQDKEPASKSLAGTNDKKVDTSVSSAAQPDWQKAARDSGMSVSSYDEFLRSLKELHDLRLHKTVYEGESPELDNVRKMVTLDGEELVKAHLKEQGYKENEITEEVNDLIDNGTMKKEARRIRKEYEKKQEDTMQKLHDDREKKKGEDETERKRVFDELHAEINKSNEVMGIKLSQEQKDALYGYITKGGLIRDIMKDYTSVIRNAFFNLQKEDRIVKILTGKGYEQGKAAVLDKFTYPESGHSSSPSDDNGKEFSPSKFIGD